MDTKPAPELQQKLLKLARNAIQQGCETGQVLEINPQDFASELNEPGCCFVTLHKNSQLRGCIGSLQPYRPLVVDIATNAFSSAFNDPRFNPLTTPELPDIQIEISVLSSLMPMSVSSEAELLAQLVPEKDGLLIENKNYRATFLPQVWEQVKRPEDFLLHLKRKAGISDNTWPEDMKCFRYFCFKFSE